MGTAAPLLIGPEQAALIARPVSANLATRDAALRPHLTRVLGFRLSPDGRGVTVFVPAPASTDVLADLRANGRVAVVFSEPATNRTVQLKGGDARVAPLQPQDLEHLRAYRDGFAEAIGALGFPRAVAQTVLGVPPEDIVAVHFTPQQGFDQTPGPRAGRALDDGTR